MQCLFVLDDRYEQNKTIECFSAKWSRVSLRPGESLSYAFLKGAEVGLPLHSTPGCQIGGCMDDTGCHHLDVF